MVMSSGTAPPARVDVQFDGAEAVERSREAVAARRQPRDPVDALVAGDDLRHLAAVARHADDDARQARAVRRLDRSR